MNTVLSFRRVRVMAVAVGVVSTVAWAPFAFMVAVGSALHKIISLLTLWAAFGALGLTGFWLWLFLAKLKFRGARTLVSAFIAAGILAIAPLAVLNRLAFVLAIPAIAVGVFALTDMWLPDEQLRQSGAHPPRSPE
jgi:hypothetical protein